MSTCLLTVRGEEVFLRVVEVVLQQDSGVGLERGTGCWTDVEAILFGAGLEQEPFWCEVR